MSEQTQVSLSDIISKLEGVKIRELAKTVNVLSSLSEEIDAFLKRRRGYFTIIYDSNDMSLRIYGRYSGCLYYLTYINEQTTLADIFAKLFNDTNTFYTSVLECLGDEIDNFVETIKGHLPQDDP